MPYQSRATSHLLAFYTNDLASAASNTALGAVADQIIGGSATGFFIPEQFKVSWAYAGNDAYTSVRLNQPSLREPFLPYIDPLSLTVLPANVPPIALYDDSGPTLYQNETLQVEASRGVVAASDAYVLVSVTLGRRGIPPGPRVRARFTAAITIAEGTWAVGAITFADNLPGGVYSVVGLSAYGTNLLAARLAFQGGGYRPGVLAQGAQGEWVGPSLPQWWQGELGSFQNTVPPQLECLGVGAGTSQIGYMDLVQVG